MEQDTENSSTRRIAQTIASRYAGTVDTITVEMVGREDVQDLIQQVLAAQATANAKPIRVD